MKSNLNKILAGFALSALGGMFAMPASAIPISYTGTLVSNAIQTDAVQGDTRTDPTRWDFWTFVAGEDDLVTVTVRRRTGALDPIFGIWFGLETDTANYTSLGTASVNTIFIGTADDTIGPNVPGPFGDPTFTFGSGTNSGTFVIAVADHTADPTAALPELGYCIQVAINPDTSTLTNDPSPCTRLDPTNVPEPVSLVLLGAGLLGLGISRRRRVA